MQLGFRGICDFAEPRLLVQLSAVCRHFVSQQQWLERAEQLWPQLPKVPAAPKRSLFALETVGFAWIWMDLGPFASVFPRFLLF